MKFKLILAVLALVLGNAAQATLLNEKVVGFQAYFPNMAAPYGTPGDGLGEASNGNHLVGDGIEVANIGDGLGWLDISDTNLLIRFSYDTYYYTADFLGFRVFDVFNTIAAISDIVINPATNMLNFDMSRVTFDADNIWINFQGLEFTSDTIVSLDIIGGQQEIPEPGTLALLGFALLGMAGALRRR